jgi:peptide/nickel transport system permease protein
MGRYLGKRALTGVLIVILSLVINFVLIHTAPGDPVRILAGTEYPSQETIDALYVKYGLDKPLPEQFWAYIGTLAHGDLGYSMVYNQPVGELIAEKAVPTIMLALTAVVLALVLGTALGIACARRAGSRLDTALNAVSYVFDSTPNFWLGLMLIMIFASWLRIFPTSGMVDLRAGYTGFSRVLDTLHHLALPLITLVLVQTPYFFRIARSSVMQVMNEDYITTYRAVGMNEKKIFRRYVFKNAILPTVTVFGISLAYIVTGVAIVEIVFSWPGMGSLMLSAISRRDYTLLMGIYLILSISVATIMILVDLVYAALDPRIRYERR